MPVKPLLVALAILVGIYIIFVISLCVLGKRTAARAIGGFIPDCIGLFKNLMTDKQVPRKYKLLLGLLIGYIAFPIDIVPDFIPIAGQLDEAILVALVLRVVLKKAGPDLAMRHWPGPASSLKLLLKIARIS